MGGSKQEDPPTHRNRGLLSQSSPLQRLEQSGLCQSIVATKCSSLPQACFVGDRDAVLRARLAGRVAEMLLHLVAMADEQRCLGGEVAVRDPFEASKGAEDRGARQAHEEDGLARFR